MIAETRVQIIRLSLKPILEGLKGRAYEEVVEKFCKPHCEKTPGGRLCPDAQRVYRKFLSLLFENYASLN